MTSRHQLTLNEKIQLIKDINDIIWHMISLNKMMTMIVTLHLPIEKKRYFCN